MLPPVRIIAGLSIAVAVSYAVHFLFATERGTAAVSVRDVYDGSISLEAEVRTFQHIDQLFPSRLVPAGNKPYPLPKSPKPLENISFLSGGMPCTLDQYMYLNRV